MKKFLLALTLTCLTNNLLGPSMPQAYAENWLKLYEDQNDIIYFDSDSFKYNEAANTISFWEKYIDTKENTNIQTRRCYNYNDKTSASMAINTYQNNELLSSNTYPEAEYRPVLPDSVGENNYNFFQYVISLTQQGIDWEFNKVFVKSPAKLSSSSWKLHENIPNAFYDTSSYRYDKETNTESFWTQSNTVIGGKNCTKLIYYLHNLNTNKFAWVAGESFVEGKLTAKTVYPIIIWHKPGVILRDDYEPSVDSFNQGLLILNRGIKK